MNYIRHLNAFFSFVRGDNRLTSSHVSLYLALFQYWNYNRFQNPFPVYRENIMDISKIGSKNTYHKCIKELHQAQYIRYHAAVSRFQPVKISMLRLDIKEEETNFRQLDLFNDNEETPVQETEQKEENPCPNIDTGSDSNLTDTSPKIDTGTDSNLGHPIKPNIKQENSVYNTHKKNIDKKEKKQNDLKDRAGSENETKKTPGVPNLGHIKKEITLPEIEAFFKENQYPIEEAKKFLYYNKSKNWMLTDKLAITDWQSLAHKWMLKTTGSNASANVPGKGSKRGLDIAQDLQFLYERFLEGKQISKLILAEYFDHLQLQITDETKQLAIRKRIDQLTGSNENSENKLWEAYQGDNANHELIRKDEPFLLSLTKRLTVLNFFEQLKQSGQNSITPKS